MTVLDYVISRLHAISANYLRVYLLNKANVILANQKIALIILKMMSLIDVRKGLYIHSLHSKSRIGQTKTLRTSDEHNIISSNSQDLK